MTNKPLTQIYILIVSSFLMTMYLCGAQPFTTRRKNWMEMFNEMMLFILALHESILLGFIDKYDAKQIVGNMMIFFVMFTVGVNALVAGFTLIFGLMRKLKRDYLFRRALKNIEKIKMDRKAKKTEDFKMASSAYVIENNSDEIDSKMIQSSFSEEIELEFEESSENVDESLGHVA